MLEPEVHSAVLSLETLEALVEDLLALADIHQLSVKSGPQQRCERSPADLLEAVTDLRAGRVRGLQITYRWQSEVWLDTLLWSREGLRLVRTRALS